MLRVGEPFQVLMLGPIGQSIAHRLTITGQVEKLLLMVRGITVVGQDGLQRLPHDGKLSRRIGLDDGAKTAIFGCGPQRRAMRIRAQQRPDEQAVGDRLVLERDQSGCVDHADQRHQPGDGGAEAAGVEPPSADDARLVGVRRRRNHSRQEDLP